MESTREFQSPQNTKIQPKEPISEENIESSTTMISPRFRSVAAMAGWDEEALLSATLIVEDTPERDLRNKKRINLPLTSTTSSRRKRRSQGSSPVAPNSNPIVVLNLDDDDEKTVGEEENDSKKTEKTKLQAMEENPLPAKASAVSSSSSSNSDSALPCMDRLREELSCAICLEICYEPSTTLCGHSFCKKCLRSAADKCGKRCPKCRQLIGNGRSCTVNTVLWNTIQLLFPKEIEARKAAGALNSREAASQSPELETHNPRTRSSRNSAALSNEVSVRSIRELPRRSPQISIYNGRTRSSQSSVIVTSEVVSMRRGRGVAIQAEDSALAFRLQREEFMEAFRGTDEQSRTASISSIRADIRARALRAISLRSGGRMI